MEGDQVSLYGFLFKFIWLKGRTLFSLTDEYLLRGLVSIILVSGMAIWGPTAAAAAAAAIAPPCLELGLPNAAAGVCGRFREGFGGGVVGGPEVAAAAAASGQATSIMAAAAAAAAAEVSEVAVEGAGRDAGPVEVAAEAEVAEADGAPPEGMPQAPWCPATGIAKGLGSDTCATEV